MELILFFKRFLSSFLAYVLVWTSWPAIADNKTRQVILSDTAREVVLSAPTLEGKSARVFSLESRILFSKLIEHPVSSIEQDMKELERVLKSKEIKIPNKKLLTEILFAVYEPEKDRTSETVRVDKNTTITLEKSSVLIKTKKFPEGKLILFNDLDYALETQVTKDQVKVLKQFLKSADLTGVKDERTLIRILKGLNKLKLGLDLVSEKKNSFSMSNRMMQFADFVERQFYDKNFSAGDRRALDKFDKILSADTVSKKEINLFRRALKDMGIPSNAYPDEFIRTYLVDLRVSEMQTYNKTNIVGDRQALDLLEQAKQRFDFINLNNLKERNRFLTTLKSFPAQFILFQAAIGASIYREHFTDPFIYDAHKNPEPLEAVIGTLSPAGVISFYIFVVTMQATELGLYKWGARWDSRMLRSIAPHVGLGTGFFVSLVLDEIIHDIELSQCVQSIMDEDVALQVENLHISPCEHSYLKWVKNGKWTRYAADIVGILSASWVSHKIIHSTVFLTRMTQVGSQLLTNVARLLGRATGWASFFITLYSFMEVHKLIDEHMIQPTKQFFIVESISSKIKDFISFIQNISLKFPHLPFDEMTREEIIEKIKILSVQFMEWPKAKGTKYEQAFFFWKTKTDKTTTSYGGASELLDYIYARAQNIEDIPQLLDREITEKESEKRAKINQLALSEGEQQIIENDYNNQIQGLVEKYESLVEDSFQFIHVSLEDFEKNNHFYSNELCFYIKDNPDLFSKIENFSASFEDAGLLEYCQDPERTALNLDLASYELSFVMVHLLDHELKLLEHQFSKKIDQQSSISLEEYLSPTPTTFFSDINVEFFEDSKTDPKNIYKKLQAARKLFNSLESDSSPYSRQAHENMKQAICAFSNLQDCETDKGVDYEVDVRLKDKALAAGYYLMKDLIAKGGTALSNNNLDFIDQIMDFVKIYRKGERFFVEDPSLKAFSESLEEVNSLTFYSFLKDFICGEPNGEITDDGRFSSPQLFPELSHMCGKLDSFLGFLDKYNAELLREKLFHTPIISNGKSYQSVYIAMEASIRERFPNKESLVEEYKSKSEQTINYASTSMVSGLQSIIYNFIVPGVLNQEPDALEVTNCKDITSFYTYEKAQNFKGLEIPLYQVKFWLSELKNIKSLEKDKNFDEKAYDKRSCRVLELLKSYHDTFATGQTFLKMDKKDEDRLKFRAQNKENILAFLDKAYPNKVVFLPPQAVFALIIQVVYPDWVVPIFLESLTNNFGQELGLEDAGYSLSVEMYKSLLQFYQQLQFIQLKDTVKEAIVSG